METTTTVAVPASSIKNDGIMLESNDPEIKSLAKAMLEDFDLLNLDRIDAVAFEKITEQQMAWMNIDSGPYSFEEEREVLPPSSPSNTSVSAEECESTSGVGDYATANQSAVEYLPNLQGAYSKMESLKLLRKQRKEELVALMEVKPECFLENHCEKTSKGIQTMSYDCGGATTKSAAPNIDFSRPVKELLLEENTPCNQNETKLEFHQALDLQSKEGSTAPVSVAKALEPFNPAHEPTSACISLVENNPEAFDNQELVFKQPILQPYENLMCKTEPFVALSDSDSFPIDTPISNQSPVVSPIRSEETLSIHSDNSLEEIGKELYLQMELDLSKYNNDKELRKPKLIPESELLL